VAVNVLFFWGEFVHVSFHIDQEIRLDVKDKRNFKSKSENSGVLFQSAYRSQMGADCRVAARDNHGVGEAPSKRVLLIVVCDWTDWLIG
jgi:hypothetical protein